MRLLNQFKLVPNNNIEEYNMRKGPLEEQLDDQAIGREAKIMAARNEAKLTEQERQQQMLAEMMREKEIAAKKAYLDGLRTNYNPIMDATVASQLDSQYQNDAPVDIDEEMVLGPNGEPIRIDPDGRPIGNAVPAPTLPPTHGVYPPTQRQPIPQSGSTPTRGLGGYNLENAIGNQQSGSGNYITDYAKRLLES